MPPKQEIVITGIGVVSPIGIGKDAYWTSLCEGRSGVRRLDLYPDGAEGLPAPFGAPVADFDAKQFVRPRKSLKVMSRDIQLAFVAADQACADAGIQEHRADPERLGVVFGADLMTCELPEMVSVYRSCVVDGKFDFTRWGQAAMSEMYPLWMLKYLPNMPACHIGIAQDARGPNNTITLKEASSLSAIAEAARVIQRGQADVIIAGGASSQVHPANWTRSRAFPFSHYEGDPDRASRPFDAQRDGFVNGEGAAAFILETRAHAEARGAAVLARLLGFASRFEPHRNGTTLTGDAIRRAIQAALAEAGLTPNEISHVNAHGLSTREDDRIEAQAIHATLGDVPVTAPKSFFGTLMAGAGAVEMVASVLALHHQLIPPTLNYEHPDADCPVNVVQGRPCKSERPTALLLNHTRNGQAVAMVIGA
jgi:3-oxoacyl-[acyl-carrier-protein] synthase II